GRARRSGLRHSGQGGCAFSPSLIFLPKPRRKAGCRDMGRHGDPPWDAPILPSEGAFPMRNVAVGLVLVLGGFVACSSDQTSRNVRPSGAGGGDTTGTTGIVPTSTTTGINSGTGGGSSGGSGGGGIVGDPPPDPCMTAADCADGGGGYVCTVSNKCGKIL